MKKQVLDKGFIEVVDSLGNDLTVVNAARVSFGKRKEVYDKSDERLVRYLAKHKHFSPFRHLQVQFHIKAPEFVMRQMYKHVVGIETTSNSSTKDHAWNEISGRYVPVEDYYYPEIWRKQSEDNKQASEGALNPLQQKRMDLCYSDYMKSVEHTYDKMIDAGVAKEQARIVLPLSQYTEVYWTASFQAIVNFIELRDETTSQWEIQQYAKVMKRLMINIYPKTTEIWSKLHWEK
ncbi:FAD-dependent thymidylate synthase [Candidatus Woesearchaeota archaeon]|nr:FAD-dependent thymidylate synthase [Candidatus Woesearchaeota archaeon]